MVALDRIPAAVAEELAAAFPGQRLLGAWLYGSRAQGSSRADSDIDIAVLCDSVLDQVMLFDVSGRLATRLGAYVDLVDLRRAGGLLRVEATQRGRALVPPAREADFFTTHALADHVAFAANRQAATAAMQERSLPDDVVMQKLASIDRCLRAVRDYVAGDLARLREPIVLDAVVLNLQRACEQAIDAACREVSRQGLGVPADSADAFTLLERERVLSQPVADRMRRMVGFRNIAVHEYRRLDPEVVRTVVEHRLDDFRALCRELSEAS